MFIEMNLIPFLLMINIFSCLKNRSICPGTGFRNSIRIIKMGMIMWPGTESSIQAVFFFFRDVQLRQSQIINRLAKSVFFVFLLHETVMGVYWYIGKIDGQYPYYSVGAFWGWLLIYLLSCLIVGVSAEALYTKFLAPLWRRVIDRICTKFKFQ